MSRFYAGLSVRELAEQRLADEDADLDDAVMVARYGRGTPQYVGGAESGERALRPSAKHLRSPMWIDAEGRTYTPDEPGRTRVWWVEIPTSITIRQRREVREGRRAPDAVVGFPEEGELLTLHHKYDHSHETQARVEALVMPKQSSAQVIFEQEIDATWRDRDRAHLERRADYRERRNAARAAAAPY
jgi:hypothetical protein